MDRDNASPPLRAFVFAPPARPLRRSGAHFLAREVHVRLEESRTPSAASHD
jgi:hypothetical protein